MSISSIILENIDNIIRDHHTNASVFAKIVPELRESLLDSGDIVNFDSIDRFDGTLAAVDGGRASEDLSGGDLMIVGAAIGEGHSTNPLYTEEDDAPVEAWGKVLPHKSNNKDIVADVMYAMELRVLHKVSADVKIIDGAYIANVSHILFALAGSNYVDSERIDTLFSAIDCDSDGILREAFRDILYPSKENLSPIISLPKSDSDNVYSKKFLKNHPHLINVISDRMLAGRLLYPGEMLFPRNIHSNPALISKLERLDKSKYTGDHPQLYGELVDEKAGLLTRLDNQRTELGILWATYFKPNVFNAQSKSLKIEFPYYKSGNNDVLEHIKQKIAIVDSDVIDGYILEPWCQYSADEKAKDVSTAINIAKNSLISTVEDSYEMAGLLRSYRT